MPQPRTATLHRMVLPDHICPFGVRAKAMLDEAGYQVDDRQLITREQVDSFLDKEGLTTTPVTFIDGARYPTSETLEQFLANQPAE